MPDEPARDTVDGGWIRDALEAHESPLILYATRILGDVERARDVVQETFLRLCKQRREDVEDHLGEWLFTVCRNQALDGLRKERQMDPMDEDRAERVESEAPSPDSAMEHADTLSHVLRSLSGLPGNQQEALRLKFQNGLSYKEISGVIGVSVGQVGWLVHHGLKTLRERLAPGEATGSEAKGAQA